MNLYQPTFNFLAKKRNSSLWQILNKLKADELRSEEELKEERKQKLRDLLIHANEYSPFWKQKFSKECVNPYSNDPLEQLKKINPITKDELIKNSTLIQNFKKKEKYFLAKTSGTTGTKLQFYRNEKWDSYNRASIFQGYSWHYVNPWDYKVYFWGLNLRFLQKCKTRILDTLQNRYRVFSYNTKDFKKLLRRKDKIKVIEGYSSSIYEFSKFVLNEGVSFPNLKLIKATSETIKEEYKQSVKKAFGFNLVSEYGSAEAGIIAFGCSKGNMHVMEHNVIIEERNKEILITNLNSHSFPIIKYKQGDYIDIDWNDHCNCGIASKILRKVIGRAGSSIVGYNNNYPSLLLYNVFKNINQSEGLSLSYISKQFKKGELNIYLKKSDLTIENQDLIKKEINRYCGNDLILIFEILESTKNKKIEKLKDFESFI